MFLLLYSLEYEDVFSLQRGGGGNVHFFVKRIDKWMIDLLIDI